MIFTKTNNNVNTSSYRFKNDTNALSLDLWNKRISISFVRKLDKNETSEDSMNYDWRNGIKITISIEDSMKFLKGMQKVLDGKKKNIGIPIFSNKEEHILHIKNKGGDYILSLFSKIDKNTKKASKKVSYVFNKGIVVEDYDDITGKHKVEKADNEIFLFENFFHEFIKASSMANTHMDREGKKYDTVKHMDKLVKIASALNVDLTDDYKNSGGYQKKISNWDDGFRAIERDEDLPF